MDDDSLRNWGYYEPPIKGHLGLQLMSSMVDKDSKSFLSGRDNSPLMVPTNGAFQPRNCVNNEPPVTHMDYVRDSWINHRDKFMHMFPENSYTPVLLEPSGTHHSVHLPHQPDTKSSIEETSVKKENGHSNKRAVSSITTPKTPKSKKPRKGIMKENGNSSNSRAKTWKKRVVVVINGIDMDVSGIPVPVCSCTNTPQQCYRWGCGGWQSACCTTTISMYPLPMSTKRRGARISGRKMSQGAFKKVLEKLADEGYDFSKPIDLRSYWAKHGSNKFVIIR